MATWRQVEQTWCLWPAKPIGLIEMIGGSYLAASPHISYRLLLEALSRKDFAVHAWGYLPGLDHQAQANSAWKSFRSTKKKLYKRLMSQDLISINKLSKTYSNGLNALKNVNPN